MSETKRSERKDVDLKNGEGKQDEDAKVNGNDRDNRADERSHQDHQLNEGGGKDKEQDTGEDEGSQKDNSNNGDITTKKTKKESTDTAEHQNKDVKDTENQRDGNSCEADADADHHDTDRSNRDRNDSSATKLSKAGKNFTTALHQPREKITAPAREIPLPAGLSDLAVRILTEIRRGTYTCMVCTGDIDPQSSVWSCPDCSRVFDLKCIRDWAKSGSSTLPDGSWRCPSCNATLHRIPARYTCWCGKVVDPAPNPALPHSCGQTCGAKLPRCVHGCALQCHPGPHAERCTAMGPVMRCHCGRHERQVPCELTPYREGWSCGEVCGELLPCGVHRCQRKCHAGLCGACPHELHVHCYCGQEEETLECGDVEAAMGASSADSAKQELAGFSCGNPCNVPLTCGIHHCTRPCHPLVAGCHDCPRSPAAVTRCPCGKKTLKELGAPARTKCTNPIATCGQICGKLLPCGRHRCYWKCHEGPCAPCYGAVDMKCRCGHTTFAVACALATDGYQPVCKHRCTAKMSCRRHVCGRICCPYQQVALARDRARARGIRHGALSETSRPDAADIEAVHVCAHVCGRLLTCGKHRCQAPCHAGPCPPCLESSNEDLVCACGRTVVPAPVRCGTKLPPCPYPCTRPTACGHPPIPHHCHPDDVPCPPCTVLITKPCQCYRHLPVKNVLCSQKIVSCGKVCGKMLSCGVHRCRKVCHLPGKCEEPCHQKCGRKLPCGHTCHRKCHGATDCDPAKYPCRVAVIIHCPCGRRSQKVACSQADAKRSALTCDDECIREKRNQMLLKAFGLNSAGDDESKSTISPSLMTQNIAVSATYSDFVLDLYKKQPVWCHSIEKILKDLVSGQLGRETHHFRPMRSVQRQFIHELSDSYRVFSESQDAEPKRSVFVKKDDASRQPALGLKEACVVAARVSKAEEQRANDRQLAFVTEQRARLDAREQKASYNALAIRDVFFGVTRDRLESVIADLVGSDAVSILGQTQVKWMSEGVYAFFGSKYRERSVEQQAELESMQAAFEARLRDKNVAMKCSLARIDDDASVVFDYEKGEEPTGGDEDTKWY